MAGGWDTAARVRREVADVVEGLSPEQLGASTLSGDWNPRQILGHLASFVELGLGQFLGQMARHRFDYDRAAMTIADRMAERPVDELLALLRDRADEKAWLPMFPEVMTVTDVIVHTQDIRRGVGLDGRPDDDVLRDALDFMVSNRMAKNLGGPKVDGLALSASDLDWSAGSGPAVEGPGEALLLALTGRDVLDELSGEGVQRLRP